MGNIEDKAESIFLARPFLNSISLSRYKYPLTNNMSRAVDADSIESSHRRPSESVYNDISEALCPIPPSLLEIELLGRSHSVATDTNLLSDGSSIAIPKIRLVQAFLYARSLFFHQLWHCPNNEDLVKTTAVILLMDPEHLTAANSRKRFILSCSQNPGFDIESVIQRELLFVDSYLTSRLHRHNKSPTLWAHRRWLLETFTSVLLQHDLRRHLEEVILIAADRHPKNYYAWLHLRWLLQHDMHHDHSDTLAITKRWCLTHPADTSGFSFLLYYFDFLKHQKLPVDGVEYLEAGDAVIKEVLHLSRSFNWTHESVWVFLRTVITCTGTGKQRNDFLETISFLMATNSSDLKAISILQAASEWNVTNSSSKATILRTV